MIDDQDAQYLEVVENQSFSPTGWLYQGIYEELRERGLVNGAAWGPYMLSTKGAEELKAWRERKV